jgi:two-component system cell cycle sensor histidine kinase/response regulator CckA
MAMKNPEPISRGNPSPTERRLQAAAWKETLSVITLGFTHDLNNVLTGILGLTEAMLLEAKPGDPPHENLTLLKRSGQQAAILVERLATLHRARAGRRDYHDLNAMVTRSLDFLRCGLSKRIEFVTELSADPVPIFVDAVELQQIIANLVLNAADAIPERGRLTLRTSRENSLPALTNWAGVAPSVPVASLVVHDAGDGIPADVLPAIFEMASSAKPHRAGVGLGLHHARRFAEQHGGAIALETAAGVGTTARLLLPLADFTEAERPSQR